MAWWKLEITDKDDPTDDDLLHIATLIQQGFTEGELNAAEECNDCDLGVTDYGITEDGLCPMCERPKPNYIKEDN